MTSKLHRISKILNKIKKWNYKGYNLTFEREVSEDNIKHYHYAEKDGIHYYPNLNPYEDPVEIMELWVDAGCPVPKEKTISSALTKNDLLNMKQKLKKDLDDMNSIFSNKTANKKCFSIKSIKPIKKAQFEKEGVDPLELPEREQFESQTSFEEDKLKPPYHTSEILNEITPIFEKRINSMFYANGSVAWFEYKDGKIYEIQISSAKNSTYNQYMSPHKKSIYPNQDDSNDKLI